MNVRAVDSELYAAWLRFMVDVHGYFEPDPRIKFQFQFIEELSAALPAGSLVVDVGAGQAELQRFFPDARYVGVDLGVGDSNWDYSNLAVCCDVHNLPIAGDVADAALNLWVMEHVTQPVKMVKEMCRILKPGGKVLAFVPFVLHEHQVPYDFFRYTRYGLKYVFEEAGFTDVTIVADTSPEYAMGYEAHKWLSMLSKRLTMSPSQRDVVNNALGITRSLMLAIAEQFPAHTGDFALSWVCKAVKRQS